MLFPFSRSRRCRFGGRNKSFALRTRRQAFETTAVTLWVLIAAITGANAAQEHAEVLASAKSNIGEAHGNPALLGTNFHDFGQRVDSNAVKFQLLAQTNTVVNGRNVTRVRFGRKGKRLGFYRQTGPRQWQEIPAARGGRRFNFTETNRDDWSVYLHDRSRNVRIQLDLHTKKVMYSDAKSARRPLYDIQGSSAKVAQAKLPKRRPPAARPPQQKPIASNKPAASRRPASPPRQAPAVNGCNVTEVTFGRGSQRFGTYTQTGNRQWQEIPARGGRRLNFTETNRDDWSVYLHDRSRNVRIQLDLHTKKVMYSDARSARRPLYEIQGSSKKAVQAPPPNRQSAGTPQRPPPRQAPAVNGRNVTEVTFGRGSQRFGTYTQTGNRQWQEIPARGGRRLNFTETNRDDWSVYLHDRSRNVRIQLDLHTKKVMYSDARSARRRLYEIQGSSKKAVQAPPPNRQSAGTPPRQAPAVNGRNVTEVTFGRGNQRFGTYTQTGNRQWQEIPARGGRRLNFTETNRDAWSVYLHDRSRNVRIQLDLHTKKVMYSDAKSARRPLYEIQGSSKKAVQAPPPNRQSAGTPAAASARRQRPQRH